MRNLALAAAITAGAALRIAALPLPGTTDVPIFKTWAHYAASEGVAGLYGTGGIYPERRLLEFDAVRTKVDYPPLALYELGLAGRFAGRAGLVVAIKSLVVLADAALAALVFFIVRRCGERAVAPRAALAIWLNPASILIGSVLGYLDPLFVLPAIGALAAGVAGRAFVAGLLLTLACLTKPLGIFIVPAIALAIWNTGDRSDAWTRVLRACAGAALAGLVLVAPIAWRGGFLNMTWGIASLLRDPFLSASGSVWAIAGPRDVGSALDALRIAGAILTAAAIGWAAREVKGARDLWLLAAFGAFSIHAYATLAVSVHENHLFAAVPLLALASAGRPRFTGVFVAVSAIVTLNLYLAYGFGVGVGFGMRPIISGIDIRTCLALLNLAAFAWHAAVLRSVSATPRVPRGVRPPAPALRRY